MSLRNPDVQLEANGWPAVWIVTILVLSFISAVIDIATIIVKAVH